MSVSYSTGVVTNTSASGRAASTIVLNTSNVALETVTVVVKIIVSMDSQIYQTAYVALFTVPSEGHDSRSFNIAGNVAYEVQVSVTSSTRDQTPATLLSVYGIDESGDLVMDQRFSHQELSMIPGININT